MPIKISEKGPHVSVVPPPEPPVEPPEEEVTPPVEITPTPPPPPPGITLGLPTPPPPVEVLPVTPPPVEITSVPPTEEVTFPSGGPGSAAAIVARGEAAIAADEELTPKQEQSLARAFVALDVEFAESEKPETEEFGATGLQKRIQQDVSAGALILKPESTLSHDVWVNMAVEGATVAELFKYLDKHSDAARGAYASTLRNELRDILNEANTLKGEALFNRYVELGFIKEGSRYGGLDDKGAVTYITPEQVKAQTAFHRQSLGLARATSAIEPYKVDGGYDLTAALQAGVPPRTLSASGFSTEDIIAARATLKDLAFLSSVEPYRVGEREYDLDKAIRDKTVPRATLVAVFGENVVNQAEIRARPDYLPPPGTPAGVLGRPAYAPRGAVPRAAAPYTPIPTGFEWAAGRPAYMPRGGRLPDPTWRSPLFLAAQAAQPVGWKEAFMAATDPGAYSLEGMLTSEPSRELQEAWRAELEYWRKIPGGDILGLPLATLKYPVGALRETTEFWTADQPFGRKLSETGKTFIPPWGVTAGLIEGTIPPEQRPTAIAQAALWVVMAGMGGYAGFKSLTASRAAIPIKAYVGETGAPKILTRAGITVEPTHLGFPTKAGGYRAVPRYLETPYSASPLADLYKVGPQYRTGLFVTETPLRPIYAPAAPTMPFRLAPSPAYPVPTDIRVGGAPFLPSPRAVVSPSRIASRLGVRYEGLDPITRMEMYTDPVTGSTFVAKDLAGAQARLTQVRLSFGEPAPVFEPVGVGRVTPFTRFPVQISRPSGVHTVTGETIWRTGAPYRPITLYEPGVAQPIQVQLPYFMPSPTPLSVSTLAGLPTLAAASAIPIIALSLGAPAAPAAAATAPQVGAYNIATIEKMLAANQITERQYQVAIAQVTPIIKQVQITPQRMQEQISTAIKQVLPEEASLYQAQLQEEQQLFQQEQQEQFQVQQQQLQQEQLQEQVQQEQEQLQVATITETTTILGARGLGGPGAGGIIPFFGLPGGVPRHYGRGGIGWPQRSVRGFWEVKGFPVYGPDPLTGEVVGRQVGKKRFKYGAVAPSVSKKKKTGIVASRRSGSQVGSTSRQFKVTKAF